MATRWRPDFCSCVIDVDQDFQPLAITPCPEHAASSVAESFTKAMEHSKLFGEAHVAIAEHLQTTAGEVDIRKSYVKGKLTITCPQLKDADVVLAQSRLDVQQAGKNHPVKIRNG